MIYGMHWGIPTGKMPMNLLWPIDLAGDAELIALAGEHDYRVHLAACFCILTLEALIAQLTEDA